MRNQRIVQTEGIRSDKRFDALMKKQEGEHQHLIASHNKEMQALRDEVRIALEKIESLSQRSEMELKDFKTFSVCQMGILKVKLEASESLIASQQKAIEELHSQLQDFLLAFCSKADVEKFKKTMEGKIADASMSHLVSFQDCQRQCKEMFTSLQETFLKTSRDTQKVIFDSMEKWEESFSQAKLDKEGIEMEIIRYKKAAFYVEKKIENIYTLIERINKRGELCHKPE